MGTFQRRYERAQDAARQAANFSLADGVAGASALVKPLTDAVLGFLAAPEAEHTPAHQHPVGVPSGSGPVGVPSGSASTSGFVNGPSGSGIGSGSGVTSDSGVGSGAAAADRGPEKEVADAAAIRAAIEGSQRARAVPEELEEGTRDVEWLF